MNKLNRLIIALLSLQVVAIPSLGQQLPVVDPISKDADTLKLIGKRVDTHVSGELETRIDNLPAGDCNGDGIGDWLSESFDADSLYPHFQWPHHRREVRLYFGKKNGFPDDDEYQRIGGNRRNAIDDIIAAGDYDDDGWPDIVIKRFPLNDSTAGIESIEYYDVIVYWGNSDANYSDDDTTHLMCGADFWAAIMIPGGTTVDMNNDGISDLVIHCLGGGVYPSSSVGKNRGNIKVPIPELYVFAGGRGQRWGRDGIPSTAAWTWWTMPQQANDAFAARPVDLNCDGASDLALFNEDDSRPSSVTILYGSGKNQFPDTTNFDYIPLDSINGSAGRLMDVTGDNVLDFVLLTDRFSAQRLRVFPGEPGKRLSQILFDTNTATGDVQWREPWAAIPTERALDPSWGDAGWKIYDLGDGNLDGYDDLWVEGGISFTSFQILGMYSTNRYLDSLIDGYSVIGNVGVRDIVNIGDIDVSGLPTYAVGYVDVPKLEDGILYLQANPSIPFLGRTRNLPHQAGVNRCTGAVSVPHPHNFGRHDDSLQLSVRLSRGLDQMTVSWHTVSAQPTGAATISLYSAIGSEILTATVPGSSQNLSVNVTQLSPGWYLLVVRSGNLIASEELLLYR